MPIRQAQMGNNTFTEAHFGSGDLISAVARQQDSDLENLLLIMQDGQPHEIGRDCGLKGVSTDEMTMAAPPMSLRFDRSASVRVVIDHLMEIEQNLIAAGQ